MDILLIEDSFSLAQTYLEYLKPTGYETYHCSSGAEALSILDTAAPSLILLDLKLPDMSGMEILDYINDHDMPVNVLVITAHGSIETAVEAMQKGAFDFILKPFNADRLTTTVRNAFDHRRLRKIVETLEVALPTSGLENFVGSSYVMKAVYEIIKCASASDAAVFITGDSGTGKELCAKALHDLSKRKGKPFVALNCGAIPRELLESEIFGHKKGAFTGALADREGAAVSASGGTLFLDEIGELDVDLQIKLLRFVQTKTFRKVGGDKDISVDIRFVCATNQDPLQQVRAGQFREDLYYRLNVIPITMPPLRDREGDILELADYFLHEYAREEHKSFTAFDHHVQEYFMDYAWPGNVRELQNIIHQIIVLNEGDTVTVAMLPELLGQRVFSPSVAQPDLGRVFYQADDQSKPLWVVEKEAIEQTIENCKGNVVKAAACLEVSPSTVYRKMRNWGIEL